MALHKYYIYSFFTKSPISINIKEENENNNELNCISVACFFISLKTANCLMSINNIIEVFCTIKKIQNEEEKSKIKEKVLFYESDIYFSINFSLEFQLPYPFLKKILGIGDQAILKLAISKKENNNANIANANINIIFSVGGDDDKIKKIKQNISEIINYSFLFPFFLYYNIEIISLACLMLTFKQMNIHIKLDDIINIISNQKETETISIDVNDINDIEICSSLIDELVLSKIGKAPQHEENNINNITSQPTQLFFNINNEYDAETKSKNDLKEKPKKESFLQRKRK